MLSYTALWDGEKTLQGRSSERRDHPAPGSVATSSPSTGVEGVNSLPQARRNCLDVAISNFSIWLGCSRENRVAELGCVTGVCCRWPRLAFGIKRGGAPGSDWDGDVFFCRKAEFLTSASLSLCSVCGCKEVR